jgi:hypothetical protein
MEKQKQKQKKKKKDLFVFQFGICGTSFNLRAAMSAAFLPDNNIEPNVGPIRGSP